MTIHVVKDGESILQIANEYGISTERLIADNGLIGLERLPVGMALIILKPAEIYTVEQGDTLSSVAASYNTSVRRLKQLNPMLRQTELITPGEAITISYEDEDEEEIEIYGFLYPNIKDIILRQSLPFLYGGAVFSYGADEQGNIITLNDNTTVNLLLKSSTLPFLVFTAITPEGSFDSDKASRLFNNSELQDTVLNNLLSVMQEKGFKGLDIDFEYVNATDRDSYINFVRKATEFMNQYGYLVNTNLAPKVSSDQVGRLYEGHDYQGIGAASNTVMVMSYEWGYTYSEPMAVAPIDQVRRVISYAVSEIPREKIYMGIPNYGYDWPLPYEKGVTKARLIGNEEAIEIASENNVRIMFDRKSMSPYFTYRASDGVNHEVWFEDIRSIKAKFDLIDEYDLRGAGYWNLTRSFNQNWAYISYKYNTIKE